MDPMVFRCLLMFLAGFAFGWIRAKLPTKRFLVEVVVFNIVFGLLLDVAWRLL